MRRQVINAILILAEMPAYTLQLAERELYLAAPPQRLLHFRENRIKNAHCLAPRQTPLAELADQICSATEIPSLALH